MRKRWLAIIVLLGAAVCSSCSQLRTLDSESGLYDVELKRSPKAMVNGAWTWGGGNPYEHAEGGAIYFAPLDISKVEKDHPDMAPLMVPQMFEYVVQETLQALKESNAANGTNWRITTQPQEATIRIDMALVHFRPQRPGLRLLSGIGGHFIKVPLVSDVVGKFAEGDICMEMTVRDGKTGKLYMACKDSNRKTARLISADAYSRSGNADVNLRYWAKRIAYLIRISSHDKLGDRTLQDVLKERSWGAVLKERYLN